MSKDLVMTAIGEDRPGLVDEVASAVLEAGGNWLESRMCHLGGQFAGILRVRVPEENEALLRASLERLSGLRVSVVTEDAEASVEQPGAVVNLELVGQDRPGIVRDISRVLAKYGVNVEELTTGCESAPMSGESLFRAAARLHIPASCELDALRKEIEALAADLMVDVVLTT